MFEPGFLTPLINWSQLCFTYFCSAIQSHLLFLFAWIKKKFGYFCLALSLLFVERTSICSDHTKHIMVTVTQNKEEKDHGMVT